MAGRVQKKYLVVLLCLLTNFSFAQESTLVKYEFDSQILESGPDTFQLFVDKNSTGEISDQYSRSGRYSAHLVNVSQSSDFVEFQGYFSEQRTGFIRLHFSFMVPSLNGVFHMALVGERRYALSPRGINFWLSFSDGWIRHKSDSIPKKLFQPNPFVWYSVDASLNLGEGIYNLVVVDEYGKRIAAVENQFFASGAGDKYSLSEFSFIGDPANEQPTDVYVDDLYITTSTSASDDKFKAPGRRKYFVEMWDDYYRASKGSIKCFSAEKMDDFGITSAQMSDLLNELGAFGTSQLLSLDGIELPSEMLSNNPTVESIRAWKDACQSLEKNEIEVAQRFIGHALSIRPEAFIFQLTKILVDAKRGESFYLVQSRLNSLGQYNKDIRISIALSLMAFNFNEYDEIDVQFGKQADGDLLLLSRLTARDARQWISNHPESLSKIEKVYFAQLWNKNYVEANRLAERMFNLMDAIGANSNQWKEKAGDALFLNGDFKRAASLYEGLLASKNTSDRLLLKLSDIYFIQGDFSRERELREGVFLNFSHR